MNVIEFDGECNAVAAVEPGHCNMQNSSLSMSTVSGYPAATPRAAPSPDSYSDEGYAGSHLAAELL